MHQDADELTIKKAYRALAKRRHIDERHGQRRPWDPVPTRKSYGGKSLWFQPEMLYGGSSLHYHKGKQLSSFWLFRGPGRNVIGQVLFLSKFRGGPANIPSNQSDVFQIIPDVSLDGWTSLNIHLLWQLFEEFMILTRGLLVSAVCWVTKVILFLAVELRQITFLRRSRQDAWRACWMTGWWMFTEARLEGKPVADTGGTG